MTLVRVHNRNSQEFPFYVKGPTAVPFEVQIPPWSYVDVDDATISKQGWNLIRREILTVAPPDPLPGVNAIGVGESVPSVVDSSLWRGAYDFTTGFNQIVTAAPGSVSSVSGAGLSRVDGQGIVGSAGNAIFRLNLQAGAGFPTHFTDVSVGMRVKSGGSPGMVLVAAGGIASGGLIWRVGVNLANCYMDNALVSGYGIPCPNDGNYHYLSFVTNQSARTLSVYRNGVLAQTLSTGTPVSKVWSTWEGGYLTTAFSAFSLANICVYQGIFSQAAVTALAAGHFPDSSGNLS